MKKPKTKEPETIVIQCGAAMGKTATILSQDFFSLHRAYPELMSNKPPTKHG